MIVGKKRGNRASRIVESYKDDVSIQVTIPNPPHSLIYKFTLDESVDPHVSKTSDKEEMHREGKGREGKVVFIKLNIHAFQYILTVVEMYSICSACN